MCCALSHTDSLKHPLPPQGHRLQTADTEGKHRQGVVMLPNCHNYSDKKELFKRDADKFQFSCSVVSDSLLSHESQNAKPPCPSPTPGVYTNSCPSSRLPRLRVLKLKPASPVQDFSLNFQKREGFKKKKKRPSKNPRLNKSVSKGGNSRVRTYSEKTEKQTPVFNSI